MANAKNIGLFAAAAVLAVVGGVSVAEWQTQRSRSDAKAEAAPDGQALAARITQHLKIFPASEPKIVAAAKADCTHKWPGDEIMVDRCAKDRLVAYKQMVEVAFYANPTLIEKTATGYCMDRYETPNGYDWDMVSVCYPRALVDVRRMVASGN